MDFRTKPTVVAGITIDLKVHNTRFVEYQPGNGTRYQMFLVDTSVFPSCVSSAIGLDPTDGGVVVAFPLGRYRTMTLSKYGYLARSYVAEKIDSNNQSDVAVLTELLGYLLDRKTEKAGP
jgi:hypothetical protein